MKDIQALLSQISAIIESDKKIQEGRRSRGEKFNVFSVLGLYSQEVQLHSRIMAELLNIHGDHGMKDAFLNALIQVTGITDLGFNAMSCVTQTECYIGVKTDTNGGRIDLLLTSDNKAIIIENKIYAGDQDNQLLRYHNNARKKYKTFRLLYLTLDGKDPSLSSLGNESKEVQYICISYKKHIKHWLERCIEISARQPLVRETLVQYLSIINHLTHQDMDISKKQEVIKTILCNYVSAEQVYNHFEEAKSQLLSSIKERVIGQLIEAIGRDYEIKNGDSPVYSSIWIIPKTEKESFLYFGVESFSGSPKANFSGDLYVGIFDNVRNESLNPSTFLCDQTRYLSKYWVNIKMLKDQDNRNINMCDASLISKLYNDSLFLESLVRQIVKEISDYVIIKFPLLQIILKR